MKRYVTEFANDLIQAEKRTAKLLEIYPEYQAVCKKRIARACEIVQQCKYGYVNDFVAVELLARISKEITIEAAEEQKEGA